eukprot:GHVP01049032.1.p1 GENE.GHVP01049032.1~~GHVP01049032.1.p1  ORF type:complete len:188 (+),score=24.99 GHVP01049032.1:637-1200(+)
MEQKDELSQFANFLLDKDTVQFLTSRQEGSPLASAERATHNRFLASTVTSRREGTLLTPAERAIYNRLMLEDATAGKLNPAEYCVFEVPKRGTVEGGKVMKLSRDRYVVDVTEDKSELKQIARSRHTVKNMGFYQFCTEDSDDSSNSISDSDDSSFSISDSDEQGDTSDSHEVSLPEKKALQRRHSL